MSIWGTIKKQRTYDEKTYPSPSDPKIISYLKKNIFSKDFQDCMKAKSKKKKGFLLWPYISKKEELRVPFFYINQYIQDREKVTKSERTKNEKQFLKENTFHGTIIQKNIRKKLRDSLYFGERSKKSMMMTMAYMMKKTGDFVFYAIRKNKLVAYVRYFDPEWKNDWTRQIVVPDAKKFDSWKKKVKAEKDFEVSNVKQWRPEGCAVWLKNTSVIGYKHFFTYMHYFLVLCKKRKVPDTVGFINLYEPPMVRKDRREPFSHFYLPFDKFRIDGPICPIFSFTDYKGYLDLVLPPPDQWEYITKLFYPTYCSKNYKMESDFPVEIPWNEKIKTLFFRGSATGCYFDEKNMRVKLAKISKKWENDSKFNEKNKIDGVPYLDAKLCSLSLWDSVMCYQWDGKIDLECEADGYALVNIFPPKELENLIDKNAFFPQKNQPVYRYLLSIEGSVAPWREPFLLSTKSTVVRAETPHKIWYEPLIKPMKHYVPVDRDLNNLAKTVTWCKKNDKKCQKIAENAFHFYNQYLSKEPSLDYLQLLIVEIENNIA
jgi:hypothetical protein